MAVAESKSTVAGIVCLMAGALGLTLSDATAKWLGTYYAPVQILFVRALVALPFVTLLVIGLAGRGALRTEHLGLHLARGAINIVSASCFYLGLGLLPLAEATAVAFAAPLFVTALSVLVLKERVDMAQWGAVFAGLAGVLLIVRPGLASFQAAALLPFTTAVMYALMMITARAIGSGEGMLTTMFYIVVGQLICSGLFLPWFWQPLRLADLPFFAGLALFSTLGLTFITWAFRIAPASVVAPFDYTGLLWATLLGWLIWREVPDTYTCAGALVIVGSGLYIVWREAAQARRRRSAALAPPSRNSIAPSANWVTNGVTITSTSQLACSHGGLPHMKLYYIPGACSLAPHIVMEWIGKPYELQAVTKETVKSPEFLKLNPAGAVPALTEGDWALTQNTAILEYLVEQAPTAGLLGDGSSRSRAEVRRWLAFLNADVHKTFSLVLGPQRYVKDEAAQKALRATGTATIENYFGILDRQLAERPYLGGAAPSVADAYLYVILRWAQALHIGQDHRNLAAFFERMQANSGVRAALKAEGLH